jgi:hypothetical protein
VLILLLCILKYTEDMLPFSDLIPTVVLTPDSPPQDSKQLVRNLYPPASSLPDSKQQTRTLFSPEQHNSEQLTQTLFNPEVTAPDDNQLMQICSRPESSVPDSNQLIRTLFYPESSDPQSQPLLRALYSSLEPFGPLYPLAERRESLEEEEEENRIPVTTVAFPTSSLGDALCIQVWLNFIYRRKFSLNSFFDP